MLITVLSGAKEHCQKIRLQKTIQTLGMMTAVSIELKTVRITASPGLKTRILHAMNGKCFVRESSLKYVNKGFYLKSKIYLNITNRTPSSLMDSLLFHVIAMMTVAFF